MTSSQKKTFRFGVGSPDEYRSAIWRVWVQGNDVYAAARSMTELVKFSLHRSGNWRFAWTEKSGIKSERSGDRAEEKWKRPTPFSPGWTQGPSIIVPNSGIKRSFRHDPEEDLRGIVWIPPASPGSRHHFTILFAAVDAPTDSWNTVTRRDDRRLAVLGLRNGDKVMVCQREGPMPDKESVWVFGLVKDMRINYQNPDPGVAGASIFSAGTDDAGFPYIVDVALGWENVNAPSSPAT